jgi:hypothetical protein
VLTGRHFRSFCLIEKQMLFPLCMNLISTASCPLNNTQPYFKLSVPISLATSLEGIKGNLFASLRRQITGTGILKHCFSFTLKLPFLPRHLPPPPHSWMIFNDRLYSANRSQCLHYELKRRRGIVVSCLVTANRM